MSKYLLRFRTELKERVKTEAKIRNISLNKMLIELISLGLIKLYEGGMNNENVNK